MVHPAPLNRLWSANYRPDRRDPRVCHRDGLAESRMAARVVGEYLAGPSQSAIRDTVGSTYSEESSEYESMPIDLHSGRGAGARGTISRLLDL